MTMTHQNQVNKQFMCLYVCLYLGAFFSHVERKKNIINLNKKYDPQKKDRESQCSQFV